MPSPPPGHTSSSAIDGFFHYPSSPTYDAPLLTIAHTMATLDASSYPHIFDLIVSHAPYPALLSLRLVSRHARKQADATLYTRVAITRRPQPNPTSSYFDRISFATVLPTGGGHLPFPLPLTPAHGEEAMLCAHPPWAHVRTVDYGVRWPEFPVPLPFGGLRSVRRLRDDADCPIAHTVVDFLRLGEEGEGVVRVAQTHALQRHVLVVHFDPGTRKGCVPMSVEQHPFRGEGVIIFHPTPSGNDPSVDKPLGELDERSATQPDALSHGGSVAFLHNILWLIANRVHAHYTLVGLEAVPLHLLGLPLAPGALPRTPEDRVAVLAPLVLAAIAAIPQRPSTMARWGDKYGNQFSAPGPFCSEQVRFMTAREYRAQFGDEAWAE